MFNVDVYSKYNITLENTFYLIFKMPSKSQKAAAFLGISTQRIKLLPHSNFRQFSIIPLNISIHGAKKTLLFVSWAL